jgi:tight adherence protein B
MMLLAFLVFVLGAGAVVGAYTLAVSLPGRLARRRMDKRLLDLASPGDLGGAADESVVKRLIEGPLPALNRIVLRTSAGLSLRRLIEQSGVRTTPSAFVIITVLVALGAWLMVSVLWPLPFLPLGAALVAGAGPILFLLNRRSARFYKFEEHFPEALDLISRALRAGHAFQTSMGMVAEEMKAPVGPEFKKTFDQQNFGLPLRDALNQMTERVPVLDVRFFVTAVLIQRDTGGNLSEILDNLAHVIRERFKIRRQIRVHTAHGRFTAFVLLSLPPGLAIALSLINPDHMKLLFDDKMGQMALMIAVVMQAFGFFWISRIIKIEV